MRKDEIIELIKLSDCTRNVVTEGRQFEFTMRMMAHIILAIDDLTEAVKASVRPPSCIGKKEE